MGKDNPFSTEPENSRSLHRMIYNSQEEEHITAMSTYPLGQRPITFAVDVSGSTRGPILEQEQAAVSQICDLLDHPRLCNLSTVIPWSHETEYLVPATEVKRLGAGGGTDPSILLRHSASCERLKKSRIWFLLTDGKIKKPLVHKFATAISTAGIHGTAAVIILFGSAKKSPFNCNVSVGLSVFAVAPHCLFLFHDVASGCLFVLQGKGCFLESLPTDKQFVSFSEWTKWDDLVQLKYEDLGKLKVPAAAELSQNTVLLPDGREFDLGDIYNNILSDAETLEILSDYKALDVILGAAKTRGREDEIKKWAEKSRLKERTKNFSETEREDIGDKAVLALKRIISGIVHQEPIIDFKEQPDSLWQKLRLLSEWDSSFSVGQDLRLAHEVNWLTFLSRTACNSEISQRIGQVFDEVLVTMEAYHCEGTRTPGTMGMMSTPISSPAGGTKTPPGQTRLSPLRSRRTTDLIDFGRRGIGHPTNRKMLFLGGFKANRQDKPMDEIYAPKQRVVVTANYGTCTVCGVKNVIQTLLLRRWAEPEQAPGLPGPNARAKHSYPFMLGNHPETDIIAPLATCDACAFTFLRAGELPNGERVHSALPLVFLEEGQNCQLWQKTLEEIYMYRFHGNIIFLVFLSTLCATIEDLQNNEEAESDDMVMALEWCCREICDTVPGIAITTDLTAEKSTLFGLVSLQTSVSVVLKMAFEEVNIASSLAQSPLLEYPLDGFITVVRLADLLGSIDENVIGTFVWKRVLFHFLKIHAQLEQKVGRGDARTKLKHCLSSNHWTESAKHTTAQQGASQFVASVSLQSLLGSDWASGSRGVLKTFRRIGDRFSAIETTSKYHGALALFLLLLNKTLEGNDLGILDQGAFFAELRQRSAELMWKGCGFYNIFEEPQFITEAIAVKMAEEISELEDDDASSVPVLSARKENNKALDE